MKEPKIKQKGITLIALVISIIVMLILAGVSLNLTIGDNGIISQAQNAKIQSGIAVLQEYVQEKYVENFDKFSNDGNKLEQFQSVYPLYFYNPSLEGIGTLKYVVDKDGHALYLFKKENLPNDISQQLVGGEAGSGTYADYASLNDVYGLTTELKVYYSPSEASELLGLTKDDLDLDDPNRTVIAKNTSLASILAKYDKDGDGNISAKEMKSIKSITIDETFNDLSQLYKLVSLEEITFSNITLENLNGIEYNTALKKLVFENVTTTATSNFEKLGGVKKLSDLVIRATSQQTITKIFNGMAGINYPLKKVDITNNPDLKDISAMKNFSASTKASVETLYLNNNSLQNIYDENELGESILKEYALACLSGFTGVITLRVNNNANLTNLKGLDNMLDLYILDADNCNLGADEIYSEAEGVVNNGKNPETDSIASLSRMRVMQEIKLNNNNNLKWIGYISNISKPENKQSVLWLKDCPNFVPSEIVLIKNIYNNRENKNIDSKFEKYLSSDDVINKNGMGLKDTSNDITLISNLGESERALVKVIDLSDNPDLTYGKIEGLLRLGFPNLFSLRLKNLTNITNLDFLQYVSGITELDIRGTSVGLTAETGSEFQKIDTYCTNLLSLYSDSDNINVLDIQNFLKRCGYRLRWSKYYINQYNRLGCKSYVTDDLGKISFYSATSGTEPWRFYQAGSATKKVDFSTSTFTIVQMDNCFAQGAILPSTVETLTFFGSDQIDLSKCTSLKNITFNPGRGYYSFVSTIINSIEANNINSLEYCSLPLYFDRGYNHNYGTIFNKLKNTNLKTLSIKSYSIASEVEGQYATGTFNFNDDPETTNIVEFHNLQTLVLDHFKDLDTSGLTDCTSLTSVTLTNDNLQDCDDFKKLTGLTFLNLSHNSISDISGLRTLLALKEVNLSYNCLDNEAVDVLRYLKQNGNLTTITLSGGNDGITVDISGL